MKHKYLFFIFSAVLLVACESQPKRDSDGLVNIIPTKERDRGPKKPVDLSHVPDAKPKREIRTIAGNKSPYKVKGVVYHVMKDPLGYEEQGIASWYGLKFHGNNTSNGERYDMYAMTGAHKTLPIPSYVKVKNLENNKEVIVRINDRGPFAPGRIIDLSYAGAQRLGFSDAGTTRVKVTYIDVDANESTDQNAGSEAPEAPPVSNANDTARRLYLQVGAFSAMESAQIAKSAAVEHTGWPVSIESSVTAAKQLIHRVHIGPIPDQRTLEIVQAMLVSEGMSEPVRVFK